MDDIPVGSKDRMIYPWDLQSGMANHWHLRQDDLYHRDLQTGG
jgi:hypothetical protein